MRRWGGRDVPQTLTEIVDPAHPVVIMHDIPNDPTGPDGRLRQGREADRRDGYRRANRRIPREGARGKSG